MDFVLLAQDIIVISLDLLTILKIHSSDNLSKSGAGPRVFNILSKFWMLRKAVTSIPNVGTNPVSLSMRIRLEFHGFLL